MPKIDSKIINSHAKALRHKFLKLLGKKECSLTPVAFPDAMGQAGRLYRGGASFFFYPALDEIDINHSSYDSGFHPLVP